MVILIDTNVIMDYFIPRQPFVDSAEKILRLCVQQECKGYIAVHSFTNIFYVLRKQFSVSKRKTMLMELCEFIDVAGIQRKQIIDALINEDFDDLEDRLQVECARLIEADYIVTRDLSDFAASPIPAVSPEDFIQKMTPQE